MSWQACPHYSNISGSIRFLERTQTSVKPCWLQPWSEPPHQRTTKSSISSPWAQGLPWMQMTCRFNTMALVWLKWSYVCSVFWRHITRYAGSHKHLLHTDCLFRYKEPVSPHLAAQLALESNGVKVRYYYMSFYVLFLHHPQGDIPSDRTLVDSIANYIRRCSSSSSQAAHLYVETAGGENQSR
jgi:hypothetical protein